MSNDQIPPAPKKRSFLRKAALWGVGIVAVLMIVLAVGLLSMVGRTVVAPDWVQSAISERIEAATPQLEVKFGQIEFTLDDNWGPQALVRDVAVKSQQGEEIIAFSEAGAKLALRPLMRGELKPKSVSISGVFATLLRDIDGNMSLRGGSALSAPSKEAANLPALIEQLDAAFELPELNALISAEIQALTLRYEDAQAGRVWVVDGGRVRLGRNRGVLDLAADLALLSGGSSVATLEANYSSELGDKRAEFGLNISEVSAQDIALQSPALAWLSVLRAPISGALRSGVLVDGTLAPLSATLQIGEGVVQPTDAAKPIPFLSARSYLTYNPKLQTIDFDELSIVSKWLTVSTEGQAVLSGLDDGVLDELVGQFQLSGIAVNPDDLYEKPVLFDAADMDFQLKLDPFQFKVGRMQVADQGKVLRLDGDLSADKDGWNFAVNAQMNGINPDRLLTLWPENLVIPARKWINQNLIAGNLTDLDVALRGGDDQRINTFVSFNYDRADVQFMKTMPPVMGASGHATMLSNRFVVAIDEGQVLAPQGGKIDVAGSVFIIPDVSLRGKVVGEVQLKTDSTVTAALSLLNQPKLEVMDNVGLPVTLADGRAVLNGKITVPLRKGVKPNDVKYSAAGLLSSVKASGLVPDKVIASDALQIAVSDSGVRIWGVGRIGTVPFDAEWSQAIGAGNGGRSQVKGTIELSERLIDEFNIGLPVKTFSGAGSAEMTLKLAKGEAPALSLTSNLRGVGIKISALGWRKSAKAAGQLTLTGRLSAQPIIDDILLDAPGLTARGTITTLKSGGLDKANFSRVTVGNWLRAPILLTGQGKGKPLKIDVFGGSLDLRKAEFGQGGGQGGGDGGPLNLKLDKLQITDTLALTDMRGTFTTKNGLDGAFTAGLNGGTQIQGQILPQNGRSAVRIKSNNAGGVFASAGLLKQARGGDLSLALLPVGKDGAFDGKLYVENTRVKDAPAIAALLNALSVVGILEQMGGSGIHFQEVEADFHLTPSTMTLINASAVGPSMGISMDGVYAVDTGTLDMRGVVSPLFFLNGIGSIFNRKGEGLIGFNYGLSGPAKSPKVSVNPLSAFTPGMFREIFRAPAPKVQN
tara:strand:- start:3663 stop:6950 length:3288 start_codon:yes stop_codon:yes gene_type:complete